MLRIIWKQILNQKKKYIWIILELLLVFCLIWYMVDYFFLLTYNKSIPSHRDMENTYMLQLQTYPEDHALYTQQNNDPQNAITSLNRIIDRIKEHPDVESVALGISDASFPGTGGINAGLKYCNAADTTKVAEIQFLGIIPTEDYFTVFRHTRNNGKTNVSVKDYDLSDPGNVVITRMMAERLFPGESAVGKKVRVYDNKFYPELREEYKVIDIVDDFKRYSYLQPYSAMFIPERLNETNYGELTIGFRTKGKVRVERLKEEIGRKLQVGNYYMENILSLTQLEKDYDYRFGLTNEIRMRSGFMIFLLINITLCVLGTFWYRVTVRKEEIGIRRALGSDRAGIIKLFNKEGLLLLSVVVIPAILIEFQFMMLGFVNNFMADMPSYGFYLPDHMLLRFLITNIITWLILALIIILAIRYPALSAGRITPVDALRDE